MTKTKALTFSGNKPLSEIKKAVKKNGWKWDQSKFDDGSDYVTFGFQHDGVLVVVIYNTFNGTFIIKDDDGEFITERSTNMDNVPWYRALLKFIYKK